MLNSIKGQLLMNIFNLSTKKEAIPVGIKKQESSNIFHKIQGMWKKNNATKEYIFTNHSLWLAGKDASEEIIQTHYLHHEENNGNFIYFTDKNNALIVSHLPIYICNWSEVFLNQNEQSSNPKNDIAINLFNPLIDHHFFEKIFFSQKMIDLFTQKNEEHLAFKITHLLCEARFNQINVNTSIIYQTCLRATADKDLHDYMQQILSPYKKLEAQGKINENSSFTLDLLIKNKFNLAFMIEHEHLPQTELKKTIMKYCNSILNHEENNSYRIYSINMNEDLLSECYENIASHEFVITDSSLSQETFEKYSDIAIAVNQLEQNITPHWFYEYIKKNINMSKINEDIKEKMMKHDLTQYMTLFDNNETILLEKLDLKEIKSPIMNDETYHINTEKYLHKLINAVENEEVENHTTKK